MISKFSGFSVNTYKSTRQERTANVKFLSYLFLFFSVEMVFAALFSTFALVFYVPLGEGLVQFWQVGLTTILISAVLVILAFSVNCFNTLPVCFIVYCFFTATFSYSCGFLASFEKSHLFYFGLWTLTAISISLAVFILFNISYLSTIETIMLVFSGGLIPLMLFLMLSQINYIPLIVVFVFVSIYGIFIATGITRSIRNELFNINDEHPASSAIKIFVEGFFVFCRSEDIFGSSWGRRRNFKE